MKKSIIALFSHQRPTVVKTLPALNRVVLKCECCGRNYEARLSGLLKNKQRKGRYCTSRGYLRGVCPTCSKSDRRKRDFSARLKGKVFFGWRFLDVRFVQKEKKAKGRFYTATEILTECAKCGRREWQSYESLAQEISRRVAGNGSEGCMECAGVHHKRRPLEHIGKNWIFLRRVGSGKDAADELVCVKCGHVVSVRGGNIVKRFQWRLCPVCTTKEERELDIINRVKQSERSRQQARVKNKTKKTK